MNFTIFKTDSGNIYLYSFYKQKTIILHPSLESILNYFNNNKNATFTNYVKDKKIKNIEETKFYFNKYQFFKKNHFFRSIKPLKILSRTVKKYDVAKSFENVRNITFEVTEKCNLACKYCAYEENYCVHTTRKQVDLNISNALNLINSFIPKWLANTDNNYQKINIGFYGGEPLLKMDFVRNIVKYLNQITQKTGLNFQFSMTTNGVLLNKYMDYLIQHKFLLLISLDGNYNNNIYRVFHNNKPSYNKVFDNINMLKQKHTKYFEKYVNFSTVLHDKNEEIEVIKFFKTNLNKFPMTSFAKTVDIKDKTLFINSKKNSKSIITNENDYKNFLLSNSQISLATFFEQYFETITKNYSEISSTKLNSNFLPTGTCFPFSKKLFVSAQGKIYPCEKINFRFSMGKINHKNKTINTNNIATLYNSYFKEIQKLCINCYNFLSCQKCLFEGIVQNNDTITCSNFISKNNHPNYLSFYWSICEKFPNVFETIKNYNYE